MKIMIEQDEEQDNNLPYSEAALDGNEAGIDSKISGKTLKRSLL